MYPSFGEIAGFDIRAAQVLRWAYFVAGAALTAYLARRRGIRVSAALGAFLVAIPAALIGGHLLNVFEAWPSYRGQLAIILNVVGPGNSIYGALAFGTLAGVAFLRWRRLPVRELLDAAAPALMLGEAMTRVGCFLAGCCFGHPTESLLGVAFPRGSYPFTAQAAAGLLSHADAASLPVHPTQLYSAAICAALLVVLLRLFRRGGLFPGALFCLALIGYGLQRLVVGIWRADAVLYWWEVSNALSAVTVLCGAGLWFVWRQRESNEARVRIAVA
jgi:phosphatidylglycerol:prolipoprotein diacylglycerol transferase